MALGAGLTLLMRRPELDVHWEHHPSHFWLVLGVALGSALVLLVIPQIPLTLGNAVVAVVDLEHRYFPLEAKRVDARSISYSAGIANVVTALEHRPQLVQISGF